MRSGNRPQNPRPLGRRTITVPIPVIVDCDPGTDDALAILLALASPELTVLAITVAGGNVGLAHTLRNACALTTLAGSKTPVYAGADRPLLGAFASATTIHGENGLGGIVPAGRRPTGPRPRRRHDPPNPARHARTGHPGRHRPRHQSRPGPDHRTLPSPPTSTKSSS